jgi:DNA-binding NarL/FixJ family response regulator
MNLEWILHPALQWAFQAAGLAFCLYLFLSAKREVRRAAREAADSRSEVDSEIASVRQSIEQIRGELAQLSQVSSRLVEPPPAASGLNLTKRSQVLRLYRRGESPGHIAAALSMPQGEVELLLKVEQIGTGPA